MFIFQSHISENVEEVKLVKDLFPESESYTHVYHKYNLLTDKVRSTHPHLPINIKAELGWNKCCVNLQTVMAHGCYLSDEELTLFRETGASVSHCPNSNIS